MLNMSSQVHLGVTWCTWVLKQLWLKILQDLQSLGRVPNISLQEFLKGALALE